MKCLYKWSFCIVGLVLVNLLILRMGHAQTNFAFNQIRNDTNGLFLRWDGAYPPYYMEHTTTPTLTNTWKPVDITSNENAVCLVSNAASSTDFFRVRGATNPPWGQYVGQLRVMEANKGRYLAPHRLKSIWDFYEPTIGAPRTTPAAYFQSLIIKVQYIEDVDVITRVGPMSSFPHASIQVTSNTLNTTWWTGDESKRKNFNLLMTFPYGIDEYREVINLSDPLTSVTCLYAEKQVEILLNGTVILTNREGASLVQMVDTIDDTNNPPGKMTINASNVSFTTSLKPGSMLMRGEGVYMFTYPLEKWYFTSITGLTSQVILLHSGFSQTYSAGHHNWYPSFVFEPQMEANLPASTREELKRLNIRYLVFNNSNHWGPITLPITLLAVGYDNSVRTLWQRVQ